jgi:hypothetical protein
MNSVTPLPVSSEAPAAEEGEAATPTTSSTGLHKKTFQKIVRRANNIDTALGAITGSAAKEKFQAAAKLRLADEIASSEEQKDALLRVLLFVVLCDCMVGQKNQIHFHVFGCFI